MVQVHINKNMLDTNEFKGSPHSITIDNKKTNKNIFILDTHDIIWSSNTKLSAWTESDCYISNVNWATRIHQTCDDKYLLILSGGEKMNNVLTDEEGHYLDEYHSDILIVHLFKHFIRKSTIKLPINYPESYSLITALPKSTKVKRCRRECSNATLFKRDSDNMLYL